MCAYVYIRITKMCWLFILVHEGSLWFWYESCEDCDLSCREPEERKSWHEWGEKCLFCFWWKSSKRKMTQFFHWICKTLNQPILIFVIGSLCLLGVNLSAGHSRCQCTKVFTKWPEAFQRHRVRSFPGDKTGASQIWHTGRVHAECLR